MLINNQLSRILQSNFVGNLSLTKEISKRFYVDYTLNFNRSISKFGSNAEPYSFAITSQTAGLNYALPNKFNIRLNNSYATFDYTEEVFDNFFTDLRFSVPLKNDKLSFELEYQNVFNAKKYFILNRNNSFQTVSILPLRNSQMLGYLNFRL
jgi:hypothetical protein